MKDAVIFNGPNTLDFQDVRTNVIRVPEVIQRVFAAQNIWDKLESTSEFSFYNFLAAEDAHYLSNIRLKSLASAIVKVGLFDRYTKNFSQPELMVGNINGDSAMLVCAGRMSFEDMIMQSKAVSVNRPNAPLSIAEAPVLSGIALTEYGVFGKSRTGAGEYYDLQMDSMDMEKVIEKLVFDHEVKKFINIGPGNNLLSKVENLSMAEVQLLESIDIDPLLSWFWPSLRHVNAV